MDIANAYNSWSSQYDTNENKTRDLEALALQKILQGKSFKHCLEIGCGTGKNTAWLLSICDQITAIDLSKGMLDIAKNKIQSNKVNFIERIGYSDNEILYNAVVTLTSITKASNFDASVFKSIDKVCQMLYNKHKENK